jgi:hypothetical protein
MTRLETTMARIAELIADPPAGLLRWTDGKVDDWGVLDWLDWLDWLNSPARSYALLLAEWRLDEDAWLEAWAHLEDLHAVPDGDRLQVVDEWRKRQT